MNLYTVYNCDKMDYEEDILIKLSLSIKREMRKADSSKSKAIRIGITEELSSKKKMAKAVVTTCRMLAGQQKSKHDSTSVIKEWRNKRYGSDSTQ